ncbi:ATP-binding protein [Amycolatopsis alkalitolerans]|uniref:Bacterial transcriptional activator domain-containing protein n=1 Tax=Amycolatopsis alkalitolerans TaxID=2547244 RepID=A0A5C4LTH6_9PSEU|nr:AAA family ATPase [Amycolatopsis alkalitolerans]TNC20569.1 hypothetical protein FG385_30560 [Amycolatopsis alkalitolerans]
MAAEIRVGLLGGFRVSADGLDITPGAWPARRAGELVQLLALADGHRLLRDRVIDALWPHLEPDAGAANLRKAAHHARQALGCPDAVVLRNGQVALFPGVPVVTDVAGFQARADEALRGGDPAECAAVASTYPGDLLPESLYEGWAEEPRRRLRLRHLELLRRGALWERLVEEDGTDEPACRQLMKAAMAAGNRCDAVRWYGRLSAALRRELGIRPSCETQLLYEACVATAVAAEPAFVGREYELAAASRVLRAGPAGEIGALVVRGPAGIGKTRLCDQVAARARELGWQVLRVRVQPSDRPCAPLLRMVDQLVAEDQHVLDRAGDPAKSTLDSLSALRAGTVLTRHQIAGALRRLLLAAGTRIVAVVDDAHESDEATIDVLLQLCGLDRIPVLPVLSYRGEAAEGALSSGVARLARAGRVVELELGPLHRGEIAQLITEHVPAVPGPEVVERITALAQGNPCFAIELARAAGDASPLPRTAADAIVRRLVDLDDATVEMLRRLALAGDDFDTDGLLGIMGLPEPEAFTVIDEALRAGILVLTDARYRFRHDLVRQALAGQLAPHRRRMIHREAAERLAAAGAAPSVIAAQWLAGARPAAAAPWLRAAVRQAIEAGAFDDALTHADTLLRHFPGDAETSCLRAEALEALGDVRAPAAFAAAAECADPAQRSDLLARQALASVRAGDPASAADVVAGLEPATIGGRLAHALALAGAAAMGFADPATGEATAARTRRLAIQSGDPAAIVIASWAEAASAHARGELPRVVETGLRSTAALPRLAASVFDGQLCVTERLLYGGLPYAEVIAFADRLAAEAERLNAARGYAFAMTLRGEAKLLSGQLDEADKDLAHGAELHRDIAAAAGESFSLQRRAEVALYRGERDEAQALLDDALAVARESDLGFHLFDRIYGTRIAMAPDPRSALSALEEGEAAVHGSMETCPGCRITFDIPAAIAAAKAGDLDRAAHYERAAQRLTSLLMRLPGWYAAVHEVRGHRARAHGDHTSATNHFAAAARRFREAGQPLDASRCEALASWS